jgi:hypothetical protein
MSSDAGRFSGLGFGFGFGFEEEDEDDEAMGLIMFPPTGAVA